MKHRQWIGLFLALIAASPAYAGGKHVSYGFYSAAPVYHHALNSIAYVAPPAAYCPPRYGYGYSAGYGYKNRGYGYAQGGHYGYPVHYVARHHGKHHGYHRGDGYGYGYR